MLYPLINNKTKKKSEKTWLIDSDDGSRVCISSDDFWDILEPGDTVVCNFVTGERTITRKKDA